MATKPQFFSGWTEPESAANTDYQPVYPYNNIKATPSGHTFEMDDTPSRERIRLQHRSGTFTEMHPTGDEVHKILGDGYSITLGDQNISIGIDDGNKAKKLNIIVYGDVNLYANGNFIQQVDGDYELHVKGNHSTTVEGLSSFASQGDYNIKAGSGKFSGVFITPGDYVGIEGDIKVNGQITGNHIYSRGRVDSQLGMSAQEIGFSTPEGGISVGTLAPIPGQINCVGPINSLFSMSAPLINSGITTSFLSTDIVNSIIRNTQIHIAPFGPTSPPTTQEIEA
jgi:cytoskeletal protein CcmA (bactofilin family)